MATAQRFVSVGTTPVLIFSGNARRASWRVTMLSTGIEAGNTGRVHVGRNFAPGTVLGSPNQGSIIVQGGEVREAKAFPEDTIFLGDVWATASAADQRCDVEEGTKD